MAGYIGSKAVITSGVSASIDELNIIDGVTATTAELNILDGVTSTAAELNILDGVTSTTAELNILDGVTATATELNLIDGVTATTAELNILDGVTATAAEINLIDGGTARGTTAVADGDGLLVNDAGTMRMTTVQTVKTFMTAGLGTIPIVFPSDWASPTNNYTSSDDWSKGSLADDDYVWFYLVNSGDGGGNARPGYGGRAMLLYGTAATFNGASYTIGAARAGQNATGGTAQNPTTVTLSSGNGSSAFTPFDLSTADDLSGSPKLQINLASIEAGVSGTYLNGSPSSSYAIKTLALPSGYGRWTTSNTIKGYQSEDPDCVFGGGAGYSTFNSQNSYSTSLFAGNGGTGNNAAGSAPGGGGGETNGGVGAAGAAGSLRVYHV